VSRAHARHVHGGGLVAHVHELQARADDGIEHGHDVVAGEREDLADPGAVERAHEDVGAPDPGGHRLPLPACEQQ
jgi:hypothetical protein